MSSGRAAFDHAPEESVAGSAVLTIDCGLGIDHQANKGFRRSDCGPAGVRHSGEGRTGRNYSATSGFELRMNAIGIRKRRAVADFSGPLYCHDHNIIKRNSRKDRQTNVFVSLANVRVNMAKKTCFDEQMAQKYVILCEVRDFLTVELYPEKAMFFVR
jgi:hypothetical protein